MKRKLIVCGLTLALMLTAGVLFAQQAATQTAAPDESAQPAEDLEAILEPTLDPDSYSYDPQGRRDPFRSLIGRTRVAGAETGIGTYLIEEIDVQGVVRTRDGYIAMVTGPENQGYSLRVGDKVFDGEVVRITPTSVVFRQETREVVRELTPRGASQN